MAMAPPLTLVLARSAPVSWAQAGGRGRYDRGRCRSENLTHAYLCHLGQGEHRI